MGLMAKWKELPPSPEAIVRAALERAAKAADGYWGCDVVANDILALASNPAEVAAIIKKAGEDRG
jgi:hypothetical protein